MNFLRPGFLWGLLAVAVPLLIHLMGRRRMRTVPFATVRFLERAQARAAARWRIRRWLLLVARMAVMACAALLYAGPGCRTPGGSGGPSTWALVLDTSPSMAAARSGVSVLERARAALAEVLDRAGPADRFVFLTTRTPADEFPPALEPVADRPAIRQALEGAGVEYGPHRPDRALAVAAAAVAGRPGARVVVATDLQASAWSNVTLPEDVPVSVIDCGPPEPANAWVKSVERGAVGLEVTVARSGPPGPVTVRVEFPSGRTSTAFLGPAEDRARFQVGPADTGGVAWVRVEPGGDLAADDRYGAVLRAGGKVSVLLVNGDPRGFAIRDELLFVRKALAPGSRLSKRIRFREIRQVDLDAGRLEGVDVVVLANPGPLGEAVTSALAERVEGGLGLVVSAGDRLGPGGGGDWGGLLPALLRDRVEVPEDDPTRPPFESVDPSAFSGPFEGVGGLEGTRVRTYWVLDVQESPGLRAWARLENGAPLVVEARVGKGRVLFLATTLDRDGADLCLQPGFVPFLERLLLYAAGRLRPRVPATATAGEPLDLPYREPVAVEGPEGFRALWKPGRGPFVPPAPGIYRFQGRSGWEDLLFARVPAGESNLDRTGKPGLLARSAPLGRGAASPAVASGRQDLSGAVAGALVAALALESLLSARWRRPGRGGGVP